ncbi:MAG: hypothetical protein HY000_35005 [Planctomycetes bacterium]|nr:hypothetical protein [Planctomycetota bacterium]
MKRIRILMSGMALVAVLTLAVGCTRPAGDTPKGGAKSGKDGDAKGGKPAKEVHAAHGEGPHGGAVGDWGGGKYHFEFTVDHDKKEATVYILGSDEKTPAPIKAKDGQLSLSIKGLKNKDEYKVVLKAEPQKGDSEGKASRFIGKDDKLGMVQEFAGTVSGEADGTPYSGDFKEEPADPKKK